MKVFLALPSVPRTATGDARLSLLKVVGRDISCALLTKAANFARSRTVPPPKPITTLISFIVIYFARATALS